MLNIKAKIIIFCLFSEFIGVTLVNKIIQVSDERFYNTSSVHCVVCLSPQVKSLPVSIYPPYTFLHLLLPPFSPVNITLLSVFTSFFFLKFLTAKSS